jgi:hypothetical protein
MLSGKRRVEKMLLESDAFGDVMELISRLLTFYEGGSGRNMDP